MRFRTGALSPFGLATNMSLVGSGVCQVVLLMHHTRLLLKKCACLKDLHSLHALTSCVCGCVCDCVLLMCQEGECVFINACVHNISIKLIVPLCDNSGAWDAHFSKKSFSISALYTEWNHQACMCVRACVCSQVESYINLSGQTMETSLKVFSPPSILPSPPPLPHPPPPSSSPPI